MDPWAIPKLGDRLSLFIRSRCGQLRTYTTRHIFVNPTRTDISLLEWYEGLQRHFFVGPICNSDFSLPSHFQHPLLLATQRHLMPYRLFRARHSIWPQASKAEKLHHEKRAYSLLFLVVAMVIECASFSAMHFGRKQQKRSSP